MYYFLLVADGATKTGTDYSKIASAFNVVMLVSLVLAAACLAFAVYCFFRFNIVKIVNDLTGRTARKSIAKRRSENEKSGDKSFRPTQSAKERGKTTDKIRESEKLINKKTKPVNDSDATAVLDDGTELLVPESAGYANQTEIIEEGTAVLVGATDVLVENSTAPETDVLPSGMELVQSIVLIHTNEVINN